MTTPQRRSARALFGIACVAAVLAVVLYVALVPSPSNRAAGDTSRAIRTEPISTMPGGALLLFTNAAPGPLFGRIAAERLPLPDAALDDAARSNAVRLIAPLSCERVHYAAGAGVCMRSDETSLPVRYFAEVFDRTFKPTHTIPLTGPPIRARISPDGRRAALTVFETGHSYADAAFSTRTIVIDTATGMRIADLEDLAVQKDGRAFKAVDFNFWGVTFTRDNDTFFATLKTGGERYLVKGSIDARTASVARSGVECPSLSPDGTLIVFKKPLEHGVGWRLHVLELATGTERALNQVRQSVDDQVDWFDDAHVVYHDAAPDGTGIWSLSVDGVSPPQLLVPNAYSPAVQR